MDNKYKFSNYKPSIITIYDQKNHVLFKEPSLIVINIQNGCILALGEEARGITERIEYVRANPPLKNGVSMNFDLTVEDVIVGSPLKNGTVADFDLASQMFKYFIYKVNGRRLFNRPRVVVCAAVDMTQIEHKAINDVILSAGAKSVLIIEKTFDQAFKDISCSYNIIIEISSKTD